MVVLCLEYTIKKEPVTLAIGLILTACFPLDLINQVIAVVHVSTSLHIRYDRVRMLNFVQVLEQIGLSTLGAGINLDVRRAGAGSYCATTVAGYPRPAHHWLHWQGSPVKYT